MAEAAIQRQGAIRSALLTTGAGPIARSAYEALAQHTELRGVVFSRNRGIRPRWRHLGDYGLWYALQYLLSRAWFILAGNRTIRNALPAELPTRIWAFRSEQDAITAWVKALDVDLVIVCGLQYVLNRRFLDAFEYVVNVHPSLLPEYRGPEPIIWGLLDRVPTFGISFHLVDEGVDTGDIIVQKAVNKPFLPLEAAVWSRLARLVPEGMEYMVQQIRRGDLRGDRQGEGFYLSLPTLANRRIRAS